MAGAGYKLFNTGDVLTAAQVNTYLNEQTVMVFASSAARTSALSGVLAEGMVSYLQDTNAVEVYNGSAWVGVSGAGDITEVQAGTGISVASGTGPIPVVTNTVATAFDAAGDLVYGTGADTFTKLSLGTAGKVLTVNSGATAPEWATPAGGGGLTLINTGGTTLTGASVSITSIPGTYKFLLLEVFNYRPVNDGASLRMQYNSQTGTVYCRGLTGAFADTVLSPIPGQDNGTSNGYAFCYIYGYASNNWKLHTGIGVSNDSGTPTSVNAASLSGISNITAAITSIQLFPDGSNFTSGTAYLYGVQ